MISCLNWQQPLRQSCTVAWPSLDVSTKKMILWVGTWSCPPFNSHVVIKLCLVSYRPDIVVHWSYCGNYVVIITWMCEALRDVTSLFLSAWSSVLYDTTARSDSRCNHSPITFFLSLLSLFLSGRVLSGFWFEFSRAHCCGRGSQLPNRPCAYLLSDWPKEESHWLPVCITTELLASRLNSNSCLSFAIYLLLASS